LNLIN